MIASERPHGAHPIIVLGMHRSGTSCITSLVHRWGAHVGEDLIAGDHWNPRGYWEHLPLVLHNLYVLREVEATTVVPPDDAQWAKLQEMARAGQYREQALSLVDRMRAGGRPWVWKDPRVSILLPFWQELLGETSYVIAVRHPSEVAASLYRKDGVPVAAGLLVWQRYMTAILRHTAACRSRHFISYNNLVRAPDHECARLCAFLDEATGNDVDDPQRVRDMVAGIDPELYRHSRQKGEPVVVSREQKALYRLALRLVAGRSRTAPDLDALEPPPGWHDELLRSTTMCVDFS